MPASLLYGPIFSYDKFLLENFSRSNHIHFFSRPLIHIAKLLSSRKVVLVYNFTDFVRLHFPCKKITEYTFYFVFVHLKGKNCNFHIASFSFDIDKDECVFIRL